MFVLRGDAFHASKLYGLCSQLPANPSLLDLWHGPLFSGWALGVLTGRHAALAYKLLGALLMAIFLTVHVPNFGAMMPFPVFTLGLAGASFALSENA